MGIAHNLIPSSDLFFLNLGASMFMDRDEVLPVSMGSTTPSSINPFIALLPIYVCFSRIIAYKKMNVRFRYNPQENIELEDKKTDQDTH